jgi:nitronate monooxygenase
MAGGPSTVALAAAAGEAGALGFLAGGYRTADQMAAEVTELRDRTSTPFGVNVFAAVTTRPEQAARVTSYAERIATRCARFGVTPGAARHTDDDLAAKVDRLVQLHPDVVSFAFGLPPAGAVERLHAAGSGVWITVTSPEDALAATEAGADALVVQGWEAGGHRGGLDDAEPGQLALLPLLQLVRRVSPLPMIAAGGLATGAAVGAVLAAGASLAQLGTAFLRATEAGTTPAHADALADDREPAGRPTTVTRAFTGRRARALVNRATVELGDEAPAAYPEVHLLTAPLRAAARAAGDGEELNLWAGQAHELVRSMPAGALVRRLTADARAALASAVEHYEAVDHHEDPAGRAPTSN